MLDNKEVKIAEDMIDWMSISIKSTKLAGGNEKVKIARAVIIMAQAYKLMKETIGMNNDE